MVVGCCEGAVVVEQQRVLVNISALGSHLVVTRKLPATCQFHSTSSLDSMTESLELWQFDNWSGTRGVSCQRLRERSTQ